VDFIRSGGIYFIIAGVSQAWVVGQHQNFEHEVKHEIDWDRTSFGFTFPMGKKTVPG
jgi:hypothetical protein